MWGNTLVWDFPTSLVKNGNVSFPKIITNWIAWKYLTRSNYNANSFVYFLRNCADFAQLFCGNFWIAIFLFLAEPLFSEFKWMWCKLIKMFKSSAIGYVSEFIQLQIHSILFFASHHHQLNCYSEIHCCLKIIFTISIHFLNHYQNYFTRKFIAEGWIILSKYQCAIV